jgi:cytochrome c oxidase subunit 3
MEATAHLEAAPQEASARLYRNRLGLWFFIASEAFLFSAAIAARYVVAGVQRPAELNQGLGLAISIVLVLSSVTAYGAESSIAHGDRPGFVRNAGLTILLGLVFMVGVVVEWSEGLRHFPPGTIYGSTFFTLIGMHAFHVFTGLVVLALVLRLGRRGRFGPGDYWPVEAAVKYWHFVDVAWVIIFPTLYLVS